MPLIGSPVSLSVEKIFFATDFSASSEKAAAWAKTLARRFSSTVEVAHIFDPSVIASQEAATLGYTAAMNRQASRESLEGVCSQFASEGIKVSAIQQEGHFPAAELLKIAKRDKVDLIVAGTLSKTGLARVILGSTAEALIRNAPCPVLTIGPNVDLPAELPSHFRNIIYATDFSPEAAKAAVFALSFAEDGGARLVLCYVQSATRDKPDTTQMIDEAFKKALQRLVPATAYDWCNPEFVVEHGEAAEGILSLADRIHADLIVLGARKSSLWLTRFARGVTTDLLAQARCPVMTVC
jgi:nucleotide-binding universal stress UspA family protein